MAQGALPINTLLSSWMKAGPCSIEVRTQEGELAALTRIDSPNSSLSNPFNTSFYGLGACYVEEGTYDITATYRGSSGTVQYTVVGFGGGAVSGGGYIIGSRAVPILGGKLDFDFTNSNAVDYDVWEAYGGDSSSSDFTVDLSQRYDLYGLYASGEGAPPTNTEVDVLSGGSFSLNNTDAEDSSNGYIDLQVYSLGVWSSVVTLCSLSASAGGSDSLAVPNFVTNLSLDAAEKVRLRGTLFGGNSTLSATGTILQMRAIASS